MASTDRRPVGIASGEQNGEPVAQKTDTKTHQPQPKADRERHGQSRVRNGQATGGACDQDGFDERSEDGNGTGTIHDITPPARRRQRQKS